MNFEKMFWVWYGICALLGMSGVVFIAWVIIKVISFWGII